jgi:lipoprotein signal peptidase
MEHCNGGIFFGFMEGSVFVIPINLLLILLVFVFILRSVGKWEKLGWGLIWMGGSLNFLDRLSFGCVRDYWKPVSFWPVFNLADSLIVGGAILLFLIFWKKNK